jgi:hypothetical protein
MKRLLLVLALMFGAGMFADFVKPSTAEAAVCARGPYRAGCAGPRGAVVAPRGGYYYRRPAYVAPRRYYRGPVYVAPRRYYRGPVYYRGY